MKLINNSKCALCHGLPKKDFYRLEVGKVLDVPKEVADIWLKYEGVQVYVAPEDVEKAKAEAVAKALKEEKAKAKMEKCAPCYENGKTPAQEDCDKCKEAAKKKNSKK